MWMMSDDLFVGHAFADFAKYKLDGDAGALDHRLSEHNFWIENNSLVSHAIFRGSVRAY
jgi:hypothetical protein